MEFRAPPELYKPSPWGERFHAARADWIVGGGAKGPGKSTAARADVLQQVWVEHQRMLGNYPHPIRKGESRGYGLFLRRELTMLGDSIREWRKLFNHIDPDYHWSNENLMATLSSGFKARLGHCKDPFDYDRYTGDEITWLCFDEMRQFDEEQVDMIGLCVRTTDPVLAKMLRKFGMTNPLIRRSVGESFVVRDPDWLRRKFVDPWPAGNKIIPYVSTVDGQKYEQTCLYLPATIRDNPNPIFRAEQMRVLSTAKPHLRKALRDGDWGAHEGSFFSEWDAHRHVVKPFRIPPDWPMWRSMDWGHKKPGCIHWYALHPDGIVFVVYELTFKGMDVKAVAKLAKHIEERLDCWDKRTGRSRIFGPADTQLWEERGDGGLNKAHQFIVEGFNWMPADKKSRQANAERLSDRLGVLPGSETIKFYEVCTEAIRTIPAIGTSQTNSEEPEDGGDDHWLDCLGPETLVTTPGGEVELATLAPGDLVLSTDGRFWPCSGARFVKRDRLYRVILEGQPDLIATGNHLVLCSDGTWRRVDQLDSMMYGLAPWIRPSLRQPVRSSLGLATTCAASISVERRSDSEEAGCFIERYTGVSSARFPSGTMSTTGMGTERTTEPRTSSLCRCANTDLNMLKRPGEFGGRSISRKRRMPREPGTEVLPELLGTESMPSRVSLRRGSGRLRSARNAEVSFLSRGLPVQVSALAHVMPEGGDAVGWTIRNELALPVGVRSWLAGSQISGAVRGDAVRILGVEPLRTGETWCISVPTMGAFVASGVVVSNSIVYGLAFASKPIPRRTVQRETWDDEEDGSLPTRRNGDRYGLGY